MADPRAAFPRFFTARANEVPRLLPDDVTLEHAVDAFRTGGRHTVEHEWVVALDAEQSLRALPESMRARLPEPLPAELAWNEVSRPGRTLRSIDAPRFFLFNVRLLEQPGDAPGLDDPVYLYGAMSGPWPSDTPHVVDGQLTVSRGDVMQGLVGCATQAFHYAGTASGVGALASRCYHMLLPGGREEDIASGDDIVVAYLLPPPGLALGGVGNDLIVAQALHDLLGAFQEDLVRNRSTAPLATMRLPVPSRRFLEHQLQAQGYEIKGDVASRKRAAKGFSGMLGSVFGTDRETLDLPPEASIEDLLGLAQQGLGALPGWPSPRSVALGRRLMASGAVPPSVPQGTPHPPDASPSSSSSRPTATSRPLSHSPGLHTSPPVLTAGHSRGPSPSEWMRDFNRGKEGERKPSRITHTDETPSRDWMRDFANPEGEARTRPPSDEGRRKPRSGGTGRPSSGPRAGRASEPPPEWMKDFQ